MTSFDYLIVGAGITGITAASILARDRGCKVLIVEKRSHIGGNCYDCINEHGILIHQYGPHIFHTQHQDVWDYLSQFTCWLDYVHYVKAFVNGRYLSFPININTLEQLFGTGFSEESAKAYFQKEKIDISEIRNAEDMVVSRMGKTIYDIFFKNYTKKQWGIDGKDLAPEVTARIPVRFNRDNRFFGNELQGMPEQGYTWMFENMLSHQKIQILTETDYRQISRDINYGTMIFTGPIDEFFDYRYGSLPYRGIHFDFQTMDQEHLLPCAVVNYPNDHDYTRISEFKQMTFQTHKKTTLCYEHPRDAVAGQSDPVPSYACSE